MDTNEKLDIGQELIEALERQRNDALTRAAIAEARASALDKACKRLREELAALKAEKGTDVA